MGRLPGRILPDADCVFEDEWKKVTGNVRYARKRFTDVFRGRVGRHDEMGMNITHCGPIPGFGRKESTILSAVAAGQETAAGGMLSDSAFMV